MRVMSYAGQCPHNEDIVVCSRYDRCPGADECQVLEETAEAMERAKADALYDAALDRQIDQQMQAEYEYEKALEEAK